MLATPPGDVASATLNPTTQILQTGYWKRTCTFTFGYSGGLPSTSTMRMPSEFSSSRLLLLKPTNFPQLFGTTTSYFAADVWAQAASGVEALNSVGTRGRAASTTRARAMTVRTAFV